MLDTSSPLTMRFIWGQKDRKVNALYAERVVFTNVLQLISHDYRYTHLQTHACCNLKASITRNKVRNVHVST